MSAKGRRERREAVLKRKPSSASSRSQNSSSEVTSDSEWNEKNKKKKKKAAAKKKQNSKKRPRAASSASEKEAARSPEQKAEDEKRRKIRKENMAKMTIIQKRQDEEFEKASKERMRMGQEDKDVEEKNHGEKRAHASQKVGVSESVKERAEEKTRETVELLQASKSVPVKETAETAGVGVFIGSAVKDGDGPRDGPEEEGRRSSEDENGYGVSLLEEENPVYGIEDAEREERENFTRGLRCEGDIITDDGTVYEEATSSRHQQTEAWLSKKLDEDKEAEERKKTLAKMDTQEVINSPSFDRKEKEAELGRRRENEEKHKQKNFSSLFDNPQVQQARKKQKREQERERAERERRATPKKFPGVKDAVEVGTAGSSTMEEAAEPTNPFLLQTREEFRRTQREERKRRSLGEQLDQDSDEEPEEKPIEEEKQTPSDRQQEEKGAASEDDKESKIEKIFDQRFMKEVGAFEKAKEKIIGEGLGTQPISLAQAENIAMASLYKSTLDDIVAVRDAALQKINNVYNGENEKMKKEIEFLKNELEWKQADNIRQKNDIEFLEQKLEEKKNGKEKKGRERSRSKNDEENEKTKKLEEDYATIQTKRQEDYEAMEKLKKKEEDTCEKYRSVKKALSEKENEIEKLKKDLKTSESLEEISRTGLGKAEDETKKLKTKMPKAPEKPSLVLQTQSRWAQGGGKAWQADKSTAERHALSLGLEKEQWGMATDQIFQMDRPELEAFAALLAVGNSMGAELSTHTEEGLLRWEAMKTEEKLDSKRRNEAVDQGVGLTPRLPDDSGLMRLKESKILGGENAPELRGIAAPVCHTAHTGQGQEREEIPEKLVSQKFRVVSNAYGKGTVIKNQCRERTCIGARTHGACQCKTGIMGEKSCNQNHWPAKIMQKEAFMDPVHASKKATAEYMHTNHAADRQKLLHNVTGIPVLIGHVQKAFVNKRKGAIAKKEHSGPHQNSMPMTAVCCELYVEKGQNRARSGAQSVAGDSRQRVAEQKKMFQQPGNKIAEVEGDGDPLLLTKPGHPEHIGHQFIFHKLRDITEVTAIAAQVDQKEQQRTRAMTPLFGSHERIQREPESGTNQGPNQSAMLKLMEVIANPAMKQLNKEKKERVQLRAAPMTRNKEQRGPPYWNIGPQ